MLKLETDAVTQELKENGREEQQIKGKTTAGGLKEKNKIKYKESRCHASNGAVESQLNQAVS